MSKLFSGSLTIVALLALAVYSVSSLNVVTTYMGNNCVAGTEVGRATSSFACPSSSDVVYDNCTKAPFSDDSYYLFNSSYCNSTTPPALFEGWLSAYSWYSSTTCPLDSFSLRIEVVRQGEDIPMMFMTNTFMGATSFLQCNAADDSLFLNQCIPGIACVNFTIPNAVCLDTKQGSFVYQTTCYENRNAPTSEPFPNPNGPVTDNQPTTVPQSGSNVPTVKTSNTATVVSLLVLFAAIL